MRIGLAEQRAFFNETKQHINKIKADVLAKAEKVAHPDIKPCLLTIRADRLAREGFAQLEGALNVSHPLEEEKALISAALRTARKDFFSEFGFLGEIRLKLCMKPTASDSSERSTSCPSLPEPEKASEDDGWVF